jgi:hypothetical protein
MIVFTRKLKAFHEGHHPGRAMLSLLIIAVLLTVSVLSVGSLALATPAEARTHHLYEHRHHHYLRQA